MILADQRKVSYDRRKGLVNREDSLHPGFENCLDCDADE